MRVTRRGWTAIGLAVGTVGMAWVFGSRALNAVAVTAVIALAVGAVQLRLADLPSVDRSTPPAGFPGETRPVSLGVDGTEGTIVRVHDPLSDGLTASDNAFDGSLPVERTYELTLAARGRQRIGPATVRMRDALGLLERDASSGKSTGVLVYPTVYDVAGSETLAAIVERARTPERQEIDRLREYVPGDPLRDIAWKASAKQWPDLVVVEFAGQQTTGTVDFAVSATRDGIDDGASAAASIGLFLLDMGLEVGLTAPDGRLEPGTGRDHRAAVLELLAETGPGTIDDHPWADADVRIVADADDVTVDTGTRTVAFQTIRTGDRTVDVPTGGGADWPDWMEVSAT